MEEEHRGPGRPKKIRPENMKVEALASDPNIIVIDGQKYILDRVTTKKIDKVEHADRVIFKPLKEDELKQDMDLIEARLKLARRHSEGAEI